MSRTRPAIVCLGALLFRYKRGLTRVEGLCHTTLLFRSHDCTTTPCQPQKKKRRPRKHAVYSNTNRTDVFFVSPSTAIGSWPSATAPRRPPPRRRFSWNVLGNVPPSPAPFSAVVANRSPRRYCCCPRALRRTARPPLVVTVARCLPKVLLPASFSWWPASSAAGSAPARERGNSTNADRALAVKESLDLAEEGWGSTFFSRMATNI